MIELDIELELGLKYVPLSQTHTWGSEIHRCTYSECVHMGFTIVDRINIVQGQVV